MVVRDSPQYRSRGQANRPSDVMASETKTKPKTALFLPSESVASASSASSTKKTLGIGWRGISHASANSRESRSRGRNQRSKSSLRANGERNRPFSRAKNGGNQRHDYYENAEAPVHSSMRPTRYSGVREEWSVIDEDDNAQRESRQPSCFAEAVEFVFGCPKIVSDSVNLKEKKKTDYKYNYSQYRQEDRDLPLSRQRGEPHVDWRALRE